MTAIQFIVLFGLGAGVYAISLPLVQGLDISWRDDLAVGLALGLPILAAMAMEPVLEGTRLDWLRLSQNPIFQLPA